jgi:hypothetical protein
VRGSEECVKETGNLRVLPVEESLGNFIRKKVAAPSLSYGNSVNGSEMKQMKKMYFKFEYTFLKKLCIRSLSAEWHGKLHKMTHDI